MGRMLNGNAKTAPWAAPLKLDKEKIPAATTQESTHTAAPRANRDWQYIHMRGVDTEMARQ